MHVPVVEIRSRWIALCAISLATIFCQVASAQSPDIVISQLYGGGGNSGAALRNDYVELFNRGCVEVDISTWSIQYASATGTAWSRTNLPQGTVLQPGQYYLVSFAAGTTGTPPYTAISPDATAATGTTGTGPGAPSATQIDLALASGKVALVRHQNTLPAVACPTAANGVVDLVSYGSASACEGSPAPATSNTTAAFRVDNGCTDTNNNAADFVTGTPNPRNSASPLNVCSTPSPASGACQFADGSCQILTESDCSTAGGTYDGDCSACAERGACCLPDDTCISAIETRCAALGGTFAGAGTRCYEVTLTNEPLEDISATGTLVPGSNTDDTTTAVQTLPFTFFYYGTPRTQYVLNPNGWISFDLTAPPAVNTRAHHILPNSFTPNNFLSPYWDDLNNATSNNIRTETRGTAPFRRFIIQWTAVPQFSGGGPNTFQIILYETTGCFEFRYGTVQPHQPVSSNSTVTFNVGFEDAAGTTGEHVNSFTIGTGGASVSRLYCPTCAPPATGACCFIDGSCAVTTPGACATAGGSYAGDNTDCSVCPPGGACCFADGSCILRTETLCNDAGGSYQGDNTNCGSITYPAPATWPPGFEDIRSVGTQLSFTGPDDAAAAITIPFTYYHYGQPRTNGLASTNGYLTFSSNGTALTNVAIPSTALPNDSLYVLWDDLHLRTVGTVHVATLGTAPYRRYIVQWTDVDQFSPSNPANVMTFQIKIFETSNCVEYHYLNIVPETPAGDYTIGVENADGTAATSYPGVSLGSGNLRLVFCPDGQTCPQPTGACCRFDGSCEIRTYAECLEVCGVYQGDGSGCDPNPCPQPTGACCFADGSCQELTAADCDTAGGAYEGNFTVCDPNPCPQPTGACCFADGSCQELTAADCDTAGGAYEGDGTGCTPNPCPQPCGPSDRADSNCDGAVNNFDIDCFVFAVVGGTDDPSLWLAAGCQQNDCDYICVNDINEDLAINNFDIDFFVTCVVNLGCP